MKKVISTLVALTMLFCLGIGTLATDIAKEETVRNYSFNSLKDEIFTAQGSSARVYNMGLKEFDEGIFRQSILIVNKSSNGTISGTATDHWFRGPFTKGSPLADVSVTGYFEYDEKSASVIDSSYDYDILGNPDQVSFTKKSIKGTDGSTAKVDLKYTIHFNVLSDTETVTVKCSKNGDITRLEQDELI